MSTKSNPRFDEILADLGDQCGALLRPWEGDCWRFQAISHPRGREILNGKGALPIEVPEAPWFFAMRPESRPCSEAGGDKSLANLQAVLHL
jgi:hypothetical protein